MPRWLKLTLTGIGALHCQTALAEGTPPKGGPQQLKQGTERFLERLFK